jgi:rubrerythrin
MQFEKAVDILEVAVRIERHSVELYVKLFESVRSSRAKELFSLLAAEEEKHLGRVRILLEKAADYRPQYIYPGEYELFVDGMAQRSLESFLSMDRALTAQTASEAIATGISLEHGVISFYSGLTGWFEGEDRKRIEALIEGEKSHLARLEELQKSYPS